MKNCKIIATEKAVNHGDGERVQVPCLLGLVANAYRGGLPGKTFQDKSS